MGAFDLALPIPVERGRKISANRMPLPVLVEPVALAHAQYRFQRYG